MPPTLRLTDRGGYNLGNSLGSMIRLAVESRQRAQAEAEARKTAEDEERRKQAFDKDYPQFAADLTAKYPDLDPFQFHAALTGFAGRYGLKMGEELKSRASLYATVWDKRRQDKTAKGLTDEHIARRESLVAPYAKGAGEAVLMEPANPDEGTPGAATPPTTFQNKAPDGSPFYETDSLPGMEPSRSVPYGRETRREVGGQTLAGPMARQAEDAQLAMQELFDLALDEDVRTGEVGKEARARLGELRGGNEKAGGAWAKFFGEEAKARREEASREAAAAAMPTKEAAALVRAGVAPKDAAAIAAGKTSRVERTYQQGGRWWKQYGTMDMGTNDTRWGQPVETYDPTAAQMNRLTAQDVIQKGKEARENKANLNPAISGWQFLDAAQQLIESGAFRPGAGKDALTTGAKYLQTLGLMKSDEATQAVSNAEAFRNFMKSAGLKNLKPLVGSTQISDRDVQNVLESMGNIETDPNSALELIRINKEAIERDFRTHNEFYGDLGEAYRMPIPTRRPLPAGGVPTKSGAAATPKAPRAVMDAAKAAFNSEAGKSKQAVTITTDDGTKYTIRRDEVK